MAENYIGPKHGETSFHCPLCGTYAKQDWRTLFFSAGGMQKLSELEISICSHCHDYALWLNEKMIVPSTGNVPLPNPDLPEDIKDDYNEAREILNKSPRGGAALLRLAIQKLCKHLGEKGSNINADIASLVKKGLPVKIQQALDLVRVVGNNAVHPGQIDLKDDIQSATHMFGLINVIAEVMITQPKEIDRLYKNLPQSQQDAIKKRDS